MDFKDNRNLVKPAICSFDISTVFILQSSDGREH